MRSTVSDALVVCRVESTSCAISAAFMAVPMVSASRISPRRITLGLSRMAERSASEYVAMSVGISRWVMMHVPCL